MMLRAYTYLAVEGGPPLAKVGEYGVAGVIGGILVWFAWKVIQREQRLAEEARAEVARLNSKIADVYVPNMERWLESLAEQKRLLEALRDERQPPPRRRST